MSGKGRNALKPLIERVLGWLEENYDPPFQALDPNAYKNWRDTIFPTGGPEKYIDHLTSLNILCPRDEVLAQHED